MDEPSERAASPRDDPSRAGFSTGDSSQGDSAQGNSDQGDASQQPASQGNASEAGQEPHRDIESGGSKKPSSQILKHELVEAREALERSTHRLLLSGFSAGLDLGFSVLLIGIVRSISEGVLAPPVLELLAANMYAFGFVLVVLGRSELFTEQTSLAVLPVLDGQARVHTLLRLWGLVYASNLVGAAIFAGLVAVIGTGMGTVKIEALGRIAEHVVDHDAVMIFLSAVLAGWLMGLLSWLVAAGRDTISQIVIVWMVTSAIGLGGLHHSILGATEVLASVFAGAGATFAQFGHFLLWTTLGNAVGGSVFVALLKYGPARVVRRKMRQTDTPPPHEAPGQRAAHDRR